MMSTPRLDLESPTVFIPVMSLPGFPLLKKIKFSTALAAVSG